MLECSFCQSFLTTWRAGFDAVPVWLGFDEQDGLRSLDPIWPTLVIVGRWYSYKLSGE